MQLVHGIMLCEGTEHERWEESESPENQNGADDQQNKLYPVSRQGAGRNRHLRFGSERPSDGENRNDDEVSSAQHRQGQCQVEENRVGVKPGKKAAVGSPVGGIVVK